MVRYLTYEIWGLYWSCQRGRADKILTTNTVDYMTTFSNETIIAVWNKGQIVPGINPSLRRKDVCGAWISWNQYGNRDSGQNEGWEIDHIRAVANNGGDSPLNLRPLHWGNNARKSDGSLVCAVSSK